MQPFQLHLATDVRFGQGALGSLGKSAAGLGQHALLVYGGGSVKRNGVYTEVMAELERAGLRVTEYSGVEPNPKLSHADRGVTVARQAGVDLVVAAGGGSVIDEAKSIAVGAVEGGPLWDFYDRRRKVTGALPLIAIQTLPASSSEMNMVSVLTNEGTGEKLSIRSPHVRPRLAFLDPSFTTTIPLQYTAYACTDILSHMMEGYFTSSDPWAPIHDGMIEGASRGVIDSMETLMEDPGNIAARSAVMWAGALAWSGLMHLGVEGASIPSHMIEHPLSARYDIAHGAGLSIVIPAWLKFARERHAGRIIRFGEHVLGIGEELQGKGEQEKVTAVIEALEEWYRRIGTPVTLQEGGIENLDVETLTRDALKLGEYWQVPGYTAEDIKAVYALCNG